MSGIYLIVWDDDITGIQDSKPILGVTKGGYPHITIAYTGKHLSISELKSTAVKIFKEVVMSEVTIKEAYVNSFYNEKLGRERHDVLLKLSDEDNTNIKSWREHLTSSYSNHSEFSMIDPHITAITDCPSILEAEEYAKSFNSTYLHKPMKLTITGVTID